MMVVCIRKLCWLNWLRLWVICLMSCVDSVVVVIVFCIVVMVGFFGVVGLCGW